jgi:hypothetical protein
MLDLIPEDKYKPNLLEIEYSYKESKFIEQHRENNTFA